MIENISYLLIFSYIYAQLQLPDIFNLAYYPLQDLFQDFELL